MSIFKPNKQFRTLEFFKGAGESLIKSVGFFSPSPSSFARTKAPEKCCDGELPGCNFIENTVGFGLNSIPFDTTSNYIFLQNTLIEAGVPIDDSLVVPYYYLEWSYVEDGTIIPAPEPIPFVNNSLILHPYDLGIGGMDFYILQLVCKTNHNKALLASISFI